MKKKIDTSQNQEMIKTRNQRRVLNYLFQERRLTIKDLSEELELSITTIITIMDYLLAYGIVKECGYMPAKRGRRPVCYSINETFKYIVTVDLGQTSMLIGISNLSGNFIEIQSVNIDEKNNGNTFTSFLTQFLEKMLIKNKIKKDDLAIIVVGNVGVVDDITGSISYAAGNAIWKSQPIKLFLEEHFPCSVIVKNDINLSTIGEQKEGVAQGIPDFAFFRFDVGAKAGIMINNQLYEGYDGAAGEIGFSIISVKNKNSISETQIENHITLNNLLTYIWNEIAIKSNGPLFSYCQKNNKKLDVKMLGDFFLTDNIVNKILTEYMVRLGNLIVNVVAVLNVPIIVLGGEITHLGEHFLTNLQKYIDNNCFFSPEIKYSSINKYGGLIGATSIGIEKFIESIK